MEAWLTRVRHDLVKYAVWRARDLRDLGASPSPGDLLALRRSLFDLRDEQGRTARASELFERLRAEIDVPSAVLDPFAGVVAEAERAVDALAARPRSWRRAVDAVLRIESAFESLARTLNHP